VFCPSDSTVLAVGNLIISKEQDLNYLLTPLKRIENNRWPVVKIVALFVLNIYSAFRAARNSRSDNMLEFAKVELSSYFYPLQRHLLTAGSA